MRKLLAGRLEPTPAFLPGHVSSGRTQRPGQRDPCTVESRGPRRLMGWGSDSGSSRSVNCVPVFQLASPFHRLFRISRDFTCKCERFGVIHVVTAVITAKEHAS